MKYCSNCGKELQDDMQFCPSCGVHTSMTFEAQSTEEAVLDEGKKSKKKRRKVLIIVCILLFLFLFGAWFLYSDSVAVDTYNKFAELYNTMSNCSVKAEEANNLILTVWQNSIYKTAREQTDRFTKENGGRGNFYENFDDALAKLYADPDFIDVLTEISAFQGEAETLIKTLAKHPKAYDEEYSDFKECFNLFLKFTNMSLHVKGSLVSFIADHNKLDVELADKLQELRIYFN